MNKTLYVRHSGRSLDLSAIADLLTTVGDIETSRLEIIPESTNATKMAIFEMSTNQQALDCADRFHGHILHGLPLSVRLQSSAISIFGSSNKERARIMSAQKCGNMNHSRSNAPVRHCPNCGDFVNKNASKACDESVHADRRKQGNNFCCDCGKRLRT